MTNYNVNLTPKLINIATEGGLDTSILNGKSMQRTFNMFEVDNSGNRKIISAKDGETFNDTTFQNSSGIGTFEAGSFAFDPNYVGDHIELSNNNCTASFTSDADEDETTVLTNYAIKSGEKVVFSMVTTYGGYEGYTGVGIGSLQTDVNSYLGEGNDSIGFWDDGKVYFGGPPITLELGFQQDGNVVDVAVDRVNNLIWFRVDGGDWNGDNTQNPSTTTGGINISSITGDAYPGACPYAYQGIFGQISINNLVSNPPAGFKVLVGSEEIPPTPTPTPTITPTLTATATPTPTPTPTATSTMYYYDVNGYSCGTPCNLAGTFVVKSSTLLTTGYFYNNPENRGYSFEILSLTSEVVTNYDLSTEPGHVDCVSSCY